MVYLFILKESEDINIKTYEIYQYEQTEEIVNKEYLSVFKNFLHEIDDSQLIIYKNKKQEYKYGSEKITNFCITKKYLIYDDLIEIAINDFYNDRFSITPNVQIDKIIVGYINKENVFCSLISNSQKLNYILELFYNTLISEFKSFSVYDNSNPYLKYMDEATKIYDIAMKEFIMYKFNDLYNNVLIDICTNTNKEVNINLIIDDIREIKYACNYDVNHYKFGPTHEFLFVASCKSDDGLNRVEITDNNEFLADNINDIITRNDLTIDVNSTLLTTSKKYIKNIKSSKEYLLDSNEYYYIENANVVSHYYNIISINNFGVDITNSINKETFSARNEITLLFHKSAHLYKTDDEKVQYIFELMFPILKYFDYDFDKYIDSIYNNNINTIDRHLFRQINALETEIQLVIRYINIKNKLYINILKSQNNGEYLEKIYLLTNNWLKNFKCALENKNLKYYINSNNKTYFIHYLDNISNIEYGDQIKGDLIIKSYYNDAIPLLVDEDHECIIKYFNQPILSLRYKDL